MNCFVRIGLVSVGWLAVAGTALADITVDYNAQPGLPNVNDSNGTPLAQGNHVWLGAFPAGYDPAANEPLSWMQHWLAFDQTVIGGTSGLLPAGRFSATASGSGAGFSGQKIYWLIFDTPSAAPPTNDLSNVTAIGLFSSTATNWQFPQDGFDNYTLVTSAQVDQAFGDGSLAGGMLQLGSLESVPTPFQNWASTHGLTGAAAAATANPTHDGIANLLKYAFNLLPTQSNPADLVAGTGVAGMPLIELNSQDQLVIEFVRRKASTNPGIRYCVETGNHPAGLTELDLTGAVVDSIDETWERITVTDPTIAMRRFGQVRVEEN